MIPSNGCVNSLRLLGSVAALDSRSDVHQWVTAAKSLGGYLAAATDLFSWAEYAIEAGLVNAEDRIQLSARLCAILDLDTRRSQYELARLILVIDPPNWIKAAVAGGVVQRNYIPQADLDDLLWLEPRLDELLIDIATRESPVDSEFKAELGLAAECVVMDALRHSGLKPIHVALISNFYGYDIEVDRGQKGVDRLEVKAAVSGTAGTFHLSRNEFDKCIRYGSEWRLIQVVFSTKIFLSAVLDCSHLEAIHELKSDKLRTLVPPESPQFRWEESALLTPEHDAWQPLELRPAPGFLTKGFGRPLEKIAPTVTAAPASVTSR